MQRCIRLKFRKYTEEQRTLLSQNIRVFPLNKYAVSIRVLFEQTDSDKSSDRDRHIPTIRNNYTEFQVYEGCRISTKIYKESKEKCIQYKREKMTLSTYHDLLKEQIKDLYSDETQLLTALPKMVTAANNQDLTDADQSKGILHDTLEEDKAADSKLNTLATGKLSSSGINKEALT